MLRNRLITAAVLAPLIALAILKLPPLWFSLYVWGLAILVASWEWAALAGVSSPIGRAAFTAVVLVCQLTAKQWAPLAWALEAFSWPLIPALALIWWFGIGTAMRMAPERLLKFSLPVAAKLAIGFWVLLSGWILMFWLEMHFGARQVLFFFVLISLADAAAYFVGTRFGNTKLLPLISPGKTVEGVYGALFAAALLATAVGFYYYAAVDAADNSHFDLIKVSDFVVLCLFTVIISVCGDLFESLAKRWHGVKDSGFLFPGHGGVLDRLDSLIAGVPVFYLGSFLRDIFL
jgi:phosphatidate cytidylyltransferase